MSPGEEEGRVKELTKHLRGLALCSAPHVHELIKPSWPLDEVRASIPSLQMRRQAQRSAVKSHSQEVVVLTLEPMYFSQTAQRTLQPPFSSHTPRKGQAGSRVINRGWGGVWAQDPASIPTQTVEAKSLPLYRRHMVPARHGLESTAKQLSFSSDSVGLWGCPPHPLELRPPAAARALGLAVCSCPSAADLTPVPRD